ncbi:MAG TPA: NAD(P)H-dependent oxidoreductase [Firmicutes bacterium]|nr:NAD(P)H-dependent oxidoreductase [Bacillota bacterium]
MKKILAIFLALTCMLTVFSFTACAASDPEAGDALTIVLQIDNPTMTVNGAETEIDPGRGTVPVIVNDRTLVPVRAIIEAMGGSVAWDEASQTASLAYNGDEIRLVIGSTTAYLNNEARELDVAPTTINDRTMLPIRFIAESFNFSVDWNETQNLITISNAPQSETEEQNPAAASNALIVYFSCTGNTEGIAQRISGITGADMYEIIPEVPYTSDDLNYNVSDSRANIEMNDENARPAISGTIDDIADYDTIILGYPIWWGTIPRIINTFIDSYDLTGKTIIPFCTSGSSGIENSVSRLRELLPGSNVTDGLRASSSTTDAEIEQWLTSSGFSAAAAASSDSAVSEQERRISLSWDDNEVIIAMEDNQTAADIISKLPATVTFEDYNNTEKICYMDGEVYVDDAARGCAPTAGDVTLFAPWGNIAIFYNDWSYSEDLIPVGRIESGLEALAAMDGDFTVTIDAVE